jgi:AP2 domain.
MNRRCLRPQGAEVQKYEGVTICDEWMSFAPFMEWSLANGYTDEMTIDRIESSKGYEPGNCRYADYSVQSANRRITDKNTSGHVGVYLHLGKWTAKVQWKKKQIHLGRFAAIEDAIKARNDYLVANDLPHLRA